MFTQIDTQTAVEIRDAMETIIDNDHITLPEEDVVDINQHLDSMLHYTDAINTLFTNDY